MKIAIPVWQGRVSPVFDSSRRVRVLDVEGQRITAESEASVDEELPQARAARLGELGVETLVCGAVSRPLADAIDRLGIRLVPFVAGEVDVILQAFLDGRLMSGEFAMPGCCGHRRHLHRGERCGWGRRKPGERRP